MRRATTVLALSAALLAPVPAMAQESPSPSPSPTANCPYVEFSVDRHVIAPGETVTVTARRVAAEGQTATGTLTRLSPEPVAVVRETSDTATVTTWPLRLGESHRFETRFDGDRSHCMPLGRPSNGFLDINVQPKVSIAAVRNAPRDYSFMGRVLPGRGQLVTLYRHDVGRRVITAQSRVQPDGSYRLDRHFTGSGRFGFSVGVGRSSTNLAGSSVTRPTVIH